MPTMSGSKHLFHWFWVAKIRSPLSAWLLEGERVDLINEPLEAKQYALDKACDRGVPFPAEAVAISQEGHHHESRSAMKIRHIIAPALIAGWYFMMPPQVGPQQITDPSAPIAQWRIIWSVNSATICETVRQKSIDEMLQEHPSLTRDQLLSNSLCIASDDPRLGARQ
jgi:hypothetical protein